MRTAQGSAPLLLLLTAIGGRAPLPAISLEAYARQHALHLFTATRGAGMPNAIDQTNNLQEGDKALLLSEKGLSDLVGISRLNVMDGGKPVPVTSVRRLHLFLNRNQMAELPEEMAAFDNVVFLYLERRAGEPGGRTRLGGEHPHRLAAGGGAAARAGYGDLHR